jgi:hypothetical protein
MRRRSVTSDTIPLTSTVPSARARAGAVVHPAGDPVRTAEPVFDIGRLATGQRQVERVVGRAVVGMDGRLPVGHLRVGLRAAEQAVAARALEELFDLAVGVGEGEVHVLADDVEQAREPVGRLRQSRGRLGARGDVGDDPVDQDAAVRLWSRPRAVPEHASLAVEPAQAVRDLGVLAAEERLVERGVPAPVVGMDARFPERPRLDVRRRFAAEEALEGGPGGVVDVVAVRPYLP